MPPHKRARSRSNVRIDRRKKPRDAVSASSDRLQRTSSAGNAVDSQLSTRASVISVSPLLTDSSQSAHLDSPADPPGEGNGQDDSEQVGEDTHNTDHSSLDSRVDALLSSSHPVYVSIPHHAHGAWRISCEQLLGAYAAATDTRTKEEVMLQILKHPQVSIRLCPTGRLTRQISHGVRPNPSADASSSQSVRTLDGVSKQVKRAIIHSLNGDTRRANNVLRQQSGIAPRNDRTMDTLHQLHPPPSDPLPPLPASAPTAVAIDVKTVRRLIRTHCNNTAAGDSASGWRNKHLLPLVTSGKCMQGIGAIIVDIINGVFTGAVKRALTACTLLPLDKPGGGVRPIGIGNTFVRLAKIYAVKMSSCDLRSMFPSIQLGCGQKNGCERVLHALQAFHERAPVHHVVCSTDIRNAFNTRRRRDMWDALVKQPSCQPLLRMVHWAYSEASQLCVYEGSKLFGTVPSAEGVVQGDPLASLMFALSMQPIYEKCIEDTDGQVRALAIQDDLYLMGDVEQVMQCLSKLKTLCGDSGLTLAVNKCQVLPCYRNAMGADTGDTDYLKSIKDTCKQADVRVVGQMEALGSVLSNYDDGVGAHVMRQVCNQQSYFDLLCHDSMPQQMAYKLLRDSANPSMNYITRVCPTDDIKDALVKWDDMVGDAFFRMHHIDVNSHGPDVSRHRRQQVHLPISMGGMGLMSVHESAQAAYTASLCTAYDDIVALDIESSQVSSSAEVNTADVATAYITQNTAPNMQYMSGRNVDVMALCEVESVQALCETSAAHVKLQHKLVQQMNKHRAAQLTAAVSESYRAVLLSASQPHASRWLVNMFDCGDVMFRPALWDAAVRHRLYLPPADMMCTTVCECGHGQADTAVRRVQPFSEQPAHFHVCDRMKGYLKLRHDVCKAVLFKELRELGAHVTLEPHLKRSGDGAVQDLRADLLVVTASGSKYIDLSIVCPAGRENVHVHGSHRHAGRSCEVAAKDKVIKYTGMLPDGCTDTDFVPLVLETYGAINREGLSWLKSVCRELSSEPETALEHMLNVMSATLQMQNGQVDVSGMTAHRVGQRAVQRSAGQVYQGHIMSLIQQYVSGVTRLDWLNQARRRPSAGQLRQETGEEEKESARTCQEIR